MTQYIYCGKTNLLLLGFGTEKLLLSFRQDASFLQCSRHI